MESSLWILPRRRAKQWLKPTISRVLLRVVCKALGYCLGENVPKDSREKKQMACFLFSAFILRCLLASLFPLLFLHQDDPSFFSQVCLVPRKQIGMTGKQCELFPAPSA